MSFGIPELLLAAPWILAALLLPFAMRTRPRLEHHEPALADADAPLVSIIVPARNEAMNIGTCIATLLSSNYTRIEIIVVDDGSSDGTGDIARIFAERADGGVRLVDGQPLPDGWVGKCWACWQGYEAARGELLLFTDADTRHDEALLGHAIGALRDRQAALVSVLPRQLMETFWERIILPQIFFLISIRFRDLQRVNRATNPRDVIANGQFMLMPRADYEAIDGHRAVRGEIVEDLRLAQAVVAHGRPIYIATAERLMETRMYRTLGGIVEGWSKNLALGSRSTVEPWLQPALPWAIGLFCLLTWVAPPAALLASLLGAGGPSLFGWSVLASGASLLFWIGSHARLRIPLLHALLYPVGALAAAGLLFRSALRGEAVGWKGRNYRVDEAGGVRQS